MPFDGEWSLPFDFPEFPVGLARFLIVFIIGSDALVAAITLGVSFSYKKTEPVKK